ncbi:ATP-binding protein [Phormidesmis sp. 146-33]
MNITSAIQASFPFESYSVQVQQFLQQSTRSFIGRQYVFDALADFQRRWDRGYFTVVGAPGSGKTACLSHYAMRYSNSLFYTSHLQSHTDSVPLLVKLSNQLLWLLQQYKYEKPNIDVFDADVALSRAFSILLRRISTQLNAEQPLVIVVDGIDRASDRNQPPSSNLCYLPRYLPPHIYFLLSRRPCLTEESRLLVEVPNYSLNLDQYSIQTELDIQTFCQQQLNTESNRKLCRWLSHRSLQKNQVCQILKSISENNFMYAREIVSAINQGIGSLENENLPVNLEIYYQQHWQKMNFKPLSAISQSVIEILANREQPLSAQTISTIIGVDEYDVNEVLSGWIEFLKVKVVNNLAYYSLYHSSFRNYLRQKCTSRFE